MGWEIQYNSLKKSYRNTDNSIMCEYQLLWDYFNNLYLLSYYVIVSKASKCQKKMQLNLIRLICICKPQFLSYSLKLYGDQYRKNKLDINLLFWNK